MAGRLKRKTVLGGIFHALVAPQLLDGKAYRPARLGVLDGVAKQVDEHLVHVHLVTQHKPVFDVDAQHRERQMLRIGLRTHDRPERFHDDMQVERLAAQVDLTAFDFAHIQHVVHEIEQVMRRQLHFVEAFLHAIALIDMLDGYVDESHDGRERRPDVVRHVRQEARLRFAGILRLLHRAPQAFLQLAFLPVLALDHREEQHQRHHHGRHKHRRREHGILAGFADRLVQLVERTGGGGYDGLVVFQHPIDARVDFTRQKSGNRLVVCVAQAEGDKSILQLAELLVVAYQVLYFLGIAVMALFNHPERCAQVFVDGGELRFNACDGLRRARER